MPDLALAKRLITDAAAKCVAAGALAARRAAFDQRRAGEWSSARGALTDALPATASKLTAINAALKTADDAAALQDFAAAESALDGALKLVAEAAALQRDSDALNTALAALKPRVLALTSSRVRASAPQIGPQVAALDTAMTAIDADAATFDVAAARTKLAAATKSCTVLETRKALLANSMAPAVLKAQLQALQQQPGGDAALDALIDTLTGVPRGTMLAAIAVRFNLSAGASDAGTGADRAGTAELKRIYAVMASVPAKHTKDNPRLRQVNRKPSGGSDYADTSGTINLGDGPGAIDAARPLADSPATEDACRPDPAAPPPSFYDWNAQHEIAHALDDKKQFMRGHAGDAAYGGWIEHGGDVLAVAEAAAAAFALPGIDRDAIAHYLDAGTVPAGPPAGWAGVKAWADGTRSATSPWDKTAQCQQDATAGGLRIGGRIYHEGYDGTWFSYAATARAQAITPYQFRAPGEWFSELYAAYKMNVLKPTHPARAQFLDKLFGAARRP